VHISASKKYYVYRTRVQSLQNIRVSSLQKDAEDDARDDTGYYFANCD